MRAVLFLICLTLISCGRPLTPTETAFAADLTGDTLDTAKIRIHRDAPLAVTTRQRETRPRLTCRERIIPEPTTDTVTVSAAAVVFQNRMHFAPNWSTDDYMRDYPQRMNLVAAMLFGHELIHVWQWQNRDVTGYTPWRAAREHGGMDDPYLFDLETKTPFLDYAYEQQASIVEEYICCAVLDPQAPRTGRMRRLIAQAIPIDTLPRPNDILLPWDEAPINGICR
ncbi:hypothetical protein [Shimia biformata]|uniref:hypothetical protein n=1 Tax=Shimia biformata TaxID=1294299 RepID=UPI0019520540|nr:hypothetical protein [Shimia biformata]